jgi:PTH1 family peptidyl-tRNA hydrolase
MKLIIGLGNPGKEYEKSRHNTGWMVLSALQEDLGFEPFKEVKKLKALVSAGTDGMEKVILAKPVTFMNLSGESAGAIAKFYKINPENILVVCDDIDLPYGSIRMRKKGSAGTHNGMKSVVTALGEDFPRLRFGIGNTSQNMTDYVLNPFTRDEKKSLKETIEKAVRAIKTFLSDGIDAAMNLYNATEI